MSFLNPFILIGLLAAGIPVLLHLFNLRKLKTIEFSTLAFLKELQKTKIRRLKFRQLLLLFLRTMLVVLLVMAFSRPTLKGSLPSGLGAQAKTTAVVLLDDSQSMTASDEQGERFKQGKDAALGVLDALRDGDEVFLVKLSEIALASGGGPAAASRDFSLLRSSIKDAKPAYTHRTVEDALRYSAKLLSGSKNFNKEVYCISDFQAGTMESKVPAQPEALFAPDTRFFLVPVGKQGTHNVGIQAISISNTIFQPEKPFVLKVKVANFSQEHVQDHLVSVFLNGSRVSQKGVDLSAGGSAEVEFSVVPKNTGYVDGMVDLEDDDLEFDNRRYFSVFIPEQLRVLLIGQPADLRYLRLALNARLTGSTAVLRVQETTAEHFSANALLLSDVVILSNVAGLSAGQTDRLRSFVEAGGGLMIFPGQQTTQDSFNSSLGTPLGLPLITSLGSTGKSGQASFMEFDKVDLRHPVFSGMFEAEERNSRPASVTQQKTPRTIESPRITAAVRYGLTPNSNVIISASDGSAFLAEQRLGSGRVLLASVSASLDWSDFPVKGIFVPLVHRSVSYLSEDHSLHPTFTVGDEAVLKIRRPSLEKLTVLNPAKQEIVLNPVIAGAGKSVLFAETYVPGIYSLQSGGNVLDRFVVDMDPDESNTLPATEGMTERILKRLGIPSGSVTKIEKPQELARYVLQTRYGTELWKYFLAIALAVAIIEMLVARDTKNDLATLAMAPASS